ncbi:MAG: methionine adenosyltransferase [Nitrososphaerota archaeon]|nr:methionine adenosyltransferase [Nitrososphaerota archaeon]
MVRRAIHVERLDTPTVAEMEVEIVERKGLGHPDTFIDGAAESVSRELCKYYINEIGMILHHNVDKGLLVGGRSNPYFGGGEVLEPIYIVVAGRAVSKILKDGKEILLPINEIATSAIKNYINSTFRFLNPEKHCIIEAKIKQGSVDLISIFNKRQNIPLANDTSIGVGFAPFTPLEELVMKTEKFLNSKELKKELPEIGEDIKVMGLRKGREIDLTVAAATISSLIPDKSHYISIIEEVKNKIEDLATNITDLNVKVNVNTGDDYSKGIFYLTVTGTSAEAGDDGNTGRGNRPSGLITPMRQYSMEAMAGKNPVNHTGKLFNILAQKAAKRIYDEVAGIKEVYVRLLSRIGAPIDQPQIASAAIVIDKDVSFSNVKSEVESILDDEIAHVTDLTPLIINSSLFKL